MSDFVALGSAVYSLVDANTSTPVYYGLVPQGSAFPAITMNRQAGTDNYTFDTEGVSTDYLIKVITDKRWPFEAANIYDNLHAAINNKHLTPSGMTALRFVRQSQIEYQEPDGKHWHVGGIYRLDAHKG
jgi:hypothetical protein